ncbi:MAG: hypothetical protein M1549_00030 [Candidatus Dependentiae bacterium]|nr:hypothetical protein [Candidatus Dependentiae bacterium]
MNKSLLVLIACALMGSSVMAAREATKGKPAKKEKKEKKRKGCGCGWHRCDRNRKKCHRDCHHAHCHHCSEHHPHCHHCHS